MANQTRSYHEPHGLRSACRLVAETAYGARGPWAYDATDYIRRHWYKRLPWPVVVWGLTPHGGCLASVRSATACDRAPVITLHPSLLGGSQRENPWGIDPSWLGPAYAFDAILHECMHVHINYNRGGPRNRGGTPGESSHNCDAWVRQVNRMAPQLGFPVDWRAGTSRPTRQANAATGTSRVVRVNAGSVPFQAVSAFPYGYRGLPAANGLPIRAAAIYPQQRLPEGLDPPASD